MCPVSISCMPWALEVCVPYAGDKEEESGTEPGPGPGGSAEIYPHPLTGGLHGNSAVVPIGRKCL